MCPIVAQLLANLYTIDYDGEICDCFQEVIIGFYWSSII